jgi:hypothetical protein
MRFALAAAIAATLLAGCGNESGDADSEATRKRLFGGERRLVPETVSSVTNSLKYEVSLNGESLVLVMEPSSNPNAASAVDHDRYKFAVDSFCMCVVGAMKTCDWSAENINRIAVLNANASSGYVFNGGAQQCKEISAGTAQLELLTSRL